MGRNTWRECGSCKQLIPLPDGDKRAFGNVSVRDRKTGEVHENVLFYCYDCLEHCEFEPGTNILIPFWDE